MRYIYIYVAFCRAASSALSLMNVEPKENSNAGQLRRWKSIRDITGECVFSCIFVCVCVWSIGALGIILLLLLCFKASGSDFIKLLQPESLSVLRKRLNGFVIFLAALCTTVETRLINGTVWVKGLTAGVTTRWLAHTHQFRHYFHQTCLGYTVVWINPWNGKHLMGHPCK